MTHDELRHIKEQTLETIRNYLPTYRFQMEDIDPRIYAYCQDAVRRDMDTANIYELLGIRRVLRLMNTYELNTRRTRQVLRAIEGTWQDGQHVKGGLKFDTPRGNMHVPLMPYQVWCIFGIYGFLTEVCMERPYRQGDMLLPSEFVKDGMVWDKRRLTTEAHLFQTRKSGKTEFGAALDYVEANVLGPSNAQVLICTNSSEQSAIAYKAVKDFCYQLDPAATNRGGGKYLVVNADEMSWKPNGLRKGEIKAMSAGGKTKDGLHASLVHADEHGSAAYVNGKSDMESLVQVCKGSMGTRRERLTLHTTTAGNVTMGPYQIQLETVELSLLKEAFLSLDEPVRTDDDSTFAFILQLDPWEQGLELDDLDQPNLFRKVNRSIGVTVQPTWYRERLRDARRSEDDRREVLTKDFNIWQKTKGTSEWIDPDRIKALQVDWRIDDLKAEDGWVVFTGLDFSLGDDLHAMTYLAKNRNTGDFFADLDSWVTEATLKNSPIKHLYYAWIEQGWLHVSPGETLEPTLPVDRIAQLSEKLTFLGFGYDPYRAKEPINALAAWIFTQGQQPQDYLFTVRQNFANYNPIIEDLNYLILSEPPVIRFSNTAMWIWEFSNVALAESNDGMENKKIVKANKSASCKIDNVQCLANAMSVYNTVNGRVQQ